MASYLCKQNNQEFSFLVLFYGFEWLIPMIYCILDERETLASQITWVCKQIDDLQLFTSKSCWFVYILQGVFIYFLRSENKYFYLVKFSHVITRYLCFHWNMSLLAYSKVNYRHQNLHTTSQFYGILNLNVYSPN